MVERRAHAATDEGKAFMNCLCNQDSVERIMVVARRAGLDVAFIAAEIQRYQASRIEPGANRPPSLDPANAPGWRDPGPEPTAPNELERSPKNPSQPGLASTKPSQPVFPGGFAAVPDRSFAAL